MQNLIRYAVTAFIKLPNCRSSGFCIFIDSINIVLTRCQICQLHVNQWPPMSINVNVVYCYSGLHVLSGDYRASHTRTPMDLTAHTADSVLLWGTILTRFLIESTCTMTVSVGLTENACWLDLRSMLTVYIDSVYYICWQCILRIQDVWL